MLRYRNLNIGEDVVGHVAQYADGAGQIAGLQVILTRGVSADMALRLAAALGTSAQFWLNLQAAYDLRKAEIERGAQIALKVERITECA